MSQTPSPFRPQMQSLSLPNGVPMVAPQNVTPSNLQQMSTLSPLSQLSKALGGNGLSSSGLGQSIQQAMQKKRELANAENYSKGMVEAAKKAATTRDTLDDITRNGWTAPQNNPFYVLGWQHQRTQELASQYRAELVRARLENPYKDPQELQDSIKQKYMGSLTAANPELVNKYFIEPAKTADDDDYKLFEQASSKKFKEDYTTSVASSIFNVASSEMDLIKSGASSLDGLQSKLQMEIDSKLKNAYATGTPYHDLLDPIFDTISNIANMQDDTKSKLSVLRTLEKVTMPGTQGQSINLLANPEIGGKYVKAKQQIIENDAKVEKDKLESAKLKRETNTQDGLREMVEDMSKGGMKPLAHYVTTERDPQTLSSVYSGLQANSNSLPEQRRSSLATGLIQEADSGADPGAILSKGAQFLKTGEIKGDDMMAAYRIATAKAEAAEKASKPRELSPTVINQYVNTIIPPVDRRTYKWAGLGKDTTGETMRKDFQSKYRMMFQGKMFDWMDKHPQATQGQIEAQAAQIWSHNIQPLWRKDEQRIQKRLGSYQDVLYDIPYKPSTQATPSTQQNKTYDSQRHSSSVPWMVNQNTFTAESQKFFQRKGQIYSWLQDSFRRKGQIGRFEAAYQHYAKQGPMALLKWASNNGYPTFMRNAAPAKNPAAGKKVSSNSQPQDEANA